MQIKRGVAVVHYNRHKTVEHVIKGVRKTVPEDTKLIFCDDGSNSWPDVSLDGFITIRGPNKGVAANKNRALWALQDCHFIAIIEDDLVPIEKGWFETYEEIAAFTNNHHFCRVQDKEVPDSNPTFSESLRRRGITPIFSSSPRGDFTFITSRVIHAVGGFNPLFRGVGYAHGEWSDRIARAGLVSHPLKWWDIKEARDKFEQRGDTEGGRWEIDKGTISTQLRKNKYTLNKLNKKPYIYHPLVLE